MFFYKNIVSLLQITNMIEFIKHSFGLCGEAHPNVIYYLGMPAIFLGFWKKIKFWFWYIILGLKSFLERLY